MLSFLVFLVYLVFFIPLIKTLIKSLIALIKEDKVEEWRKWKSGIWIAVFGTVGLSLILWALNIYTEVLWFSSLGYVSRFWKEFTWKWLLFLGFGAVSFVFIRVNLAVVASGVPSIPKDYKKDYHSDTDWRSTTEAIKWLFRLGLVSIVVYMGFWAYGQWGKVLLYLNQVSTGISEPILGQDVSFYLFTLPLYMFVNSWLLALFAFTLLCAMSLYTFYYFRVRSTVGRDEANVFGKKWFSHTLLLLLPVILLWIWRTKLAIYNLLYSEHGVVFGPGYADVHARIFAYKLFMVLLVIVGIAYLVNAFWRRWKLSLGISAGLLAAWIVVLGIVPAYVQRYVVEPTGITKETPYIKHNIEFTRRAYGLDKVDERDFQVKKDLTLEMIRRNPLTIENVRLWDWRALKDNYIQIQALRLYYQFNDVDIDRYTINGKYRQVMSAARELNKDKLREKTWINERFKYTHGYGVVLNQVNEFLSDGSVNPLIQDAPPVSSVQTLKVTRPEIYYGELTRDHVFVKTTEKEFDYPKGDENAYTFYEGTGGVALGTGLRKLAFALRFDGLRFLLSSYLKPESRIMFHRQIKERVEILAPFLTFDKDNYLVVEGKLWWLWDAYTISNDYPYSERFKAFPEKYMTSGSNPEERIRYRSINYIRNSVKTVVDPYNGKVDFYVFDEEDPIIQTYRKVFPDLFKSKDKMPLELQKHIRYPEDLLSIQAQVYSIYHMEDPQVFYTKEDMWKFADEKYIGKRQSVLPYYVIICLPGEKKEEFIQTIPFTPYSEDNSKNNMIAWMAGRCDGDNYGKLLVYKLPKGEFFYGPMLIESRVDQNDQMSGQLTLWDQRGSTVIRGNLLVIPIENSFLFVEPIFLQAEDAKMPQIQRVVVATLTRGPAWGKTFEQALENLYSGEYLPEVSEGEVPEVSKRSLTEIIKSAGEHFKRYQKFTGEGKLDQAGRELKALAEDLKALLGRTGVGVEPNK